MHKNLYWLIFLLFIALTVLGYTGFAGYKVYQYNRLSQSLPVESIDWTIQPLEIDNYALQSTYTFISNQKTYFGQADYPEHYLNDWAAQEGLEKRQSKKWRVWFDPTDPDFSSLYHDYPYKQILYAFVLWGLLLYFAWLGHSVTRYTGTS